MSSSSAGAKKAAQGICEFLEKHPHIQKITEKVGDFARIIDEATGLPQLEATIQNAIGAMGDPTNRELMRPEEIMESAMDLLKQGQAVILRSH